MNNSNNLNKEVELDCCLRLFIDFIENTKNKYIINIGKQTLYNDEPKIFAYSAVYKTKCSCNKDMAGGFSFDKKTALVRVLGESIERYCLENFSPKYSLTGSSKEIKDPHLDPLAICYFLEMQLKNKYFGIPRVNKKSKFKWIKGTLLMDSMIKKKILIPAQFVIMNYKLMKNEPRIFLPVSTGTALGLNLEDAVYRGICETIERDAFMISYLNKLPSPQIDLKSVEDRSLNEIINILNRYKLELIVVDLTTDLQIPSFAAIILDKTGLGPAVSIGLKAGFDIKDVIMGAIEESIMTRSWIRDKFVYINPDYKRKKIITLIEDRANYWFPKETIRKLDFWLKNENVKKISLNTTKSKKVKLREMIELLKKKNMQVIYIDLADNIIKKSGFQVVKVIIPQLQPLYLDERYPYLGGERLYKAPVVMGASKNPKNFEELNKIPHPFL